LRIGGVTDVTCHPPGSWSAGQTFSCDVIGTSQRDLGQYVGTVQATTSSGVWRWRGQWRPSHQYSVT
jgi:hypothetical protein